MFEPCIVIPCYNHGRPLAPLLTTLAGQGAPCIVVDDGSNGETAAILEGLERAHPQVQVVRLPVNSGKGAATERGLREAARRGFSHALQIDADGQHAAADVPRLLENARTFPVAMICGRPVFDESIPPLRRYGRYFTHALVWLETLSFQIKDGLCGFRVYPLAATMALLERQRMGARMDFDPEILVRMVRQGVPMRFVPTRVVYPAGGRSNFRMLRDNLLMVRLHLRLLLGLPLFALRRAWRGSVQNRHWSITRERGSLFGIRLVWWMYRYLGRRACMLIMHFCIAYFWLTGTAARRASRNYLRALRETAGRRGVALPRRLNSYSHFFKYGVSILDMLVAWNGQLQWEHTKTTPIELYREMRYSGKGAVIIGSHLGSLELGRANADREGEQRASALVFRSHANRLQRALIQINPSAGRNEIPINDLGPDTAILLRQRIEAGEWIVIDGDRTPPQGGGRVAWAEFLGRPAPFPQGTFILATLLECPVYLLFIWKGVHGPERYVERFEVPAGLPRKDRQAAVAEMVQRYARRLEHYCFLSPLEWFNFYDFWHETAAVPPNATEMNNFPGCGTGGPASWNPGDSPDPPT